MAENQGRRRLHAAAPWLFLCLALTFFEYQVLFLGRTHLPVVAGHGVFGWRVAEAPTVRLPEDRYRIDRGASAWVMEPQGSIAAAAWKAGRLPLWNPYQGAGAPLAANAQSGAFDPLRLPSSLVTGSVAWDAYYLGRRLLGLVLAYLFARALGLRMLGCVALAIAYVFSGFFAVFGNNHYVEVYLLLPGLLWGSEMVLAGRLRAGGIVLTLGVAAVQLAGMPEAAFCVLLYVAGYDVWRLVGRSSPTRALRALLSRQARWLLGAWATGLLLSAPLLLPFVEFLQNAVHVHGPERQLGLTHDAWEDLVLLAAPFLHGLPVPGEIGWSYTGAAVIALGLLGVVCIRRNKVGVYPFLFGFVLLAKVFGAPLVNELGRLPLVALMPVQKWAGPLVSFTFALLAAGAVDLLDRRDVTRREILVALIAFAGLGLVALLLDGARLQQAPLARVGTWIGIACASGGAALLLGTWRKRAGVACACVVTLEILTLQPHGNLSPRYDPFAEPPFVRYLRQQEKEAPGSRVFSAKGLLHPNTAGVFGLSDIRTVDALYPWRYFRYVREFLIDGHLYDRYTGIASGQEGETQMHGNPWFDLLGVRHVVGGRRIHAEHLAPAGQYRLAYEGPPPVFENVHAFPRAFLVGAARWVPGPGEAIAAMKDADLDPSRVAVLEGPETPLSAVALGSRTAGTASVTRYESQRVEVLVDAYVPAVLVLTDTYYPGWRAMLDGNPIPLRPAYLALRGVVVPSGRHRVVFYYRPLSFTVGCLLSCLGAVAFAVALGTGGRNPIRRNHS